MSIIKFLEAMKEWKDKCKDAEGTVKKPRISNYIGECFLRLQMDYRIDPILSTTHTTRNDIRWYRECLQYIHNFDSDKSKNPFSYFTQIIYYAFIRRIQKEKKQRHIKNKMIEKRSYDTYNYGG